MTKRFWTEQEVALLTKYYSDPAVFASDIAARLGRNVRQIYNKARALGLSRPEEIRSIAGKIGSQYPEAIAHRIQPGHTPPNKGKKMSPELYAKCAPTMFKKGQICKNHREVGSERVNVDGYVEIKVAEPNKWKLKHRVIWEQTNGAIPKGSNIQFKDGNPQNVSIDNLYIITRAEQLRTKNSLMARYPAELQQIIRLRGTVKRQITMYNKKQSNSKSNE